MAGLVDGLRDIMNIGSQLTEPMYQFSQETGLSAQKMQQWSEYAQTLGVKGDVVSNSLAGLQKKMAAMQFGDSSLLSGIYLLQQAGADINQNDLNDPFSFLDKATIGLQKIDPKLRTYVAGLLGLNEQLLLVKNGFAGSANLPSPTAEQIQAIRDYNNVWTGVGIIFKQIVTDLAADFAPSLIDLGNHIKEFFTVLHDYPAEIRTIFDALIGLGALATGPLGQLVYILYMIVTHLKEIGDAARVTGEAIRKAFGIDNISKNKMWTSDLPNSFLGKTLDSLNTPSSPNSIGNVSRETSKQVTQHNNLYINGGNAKEIAKEIDDRLNQHLSLAFYQNSTNY